MAKSEIGENVRVTPEDDPMLIAKLQKIAPHIHLRTNTLAKKFLHEKCDEYMTLHNLTLDSAQSAERVD
jgi:hypothetical protein